MAAAGCIKGRQTIKPLMVSAFAWQQTFDQQSIISIDQELVMSAIYLGINIDHVATLRQARGTYYPEPVHAALLAEQFGADGITVHLREDRRHIIDRDVFVLRQTIATRLNFEMAVTDEMLQIATELKPHFACFVPEKRQELTTEGGLEVAGQLSRITAAVTQMREQNILVSLFIDADQRQIFDPLVAFENFVGDAGQGAIDAGLIEKGRSTL